MSRSIRDLGQDIPLPQVLAYDCQNKHEIKKKSPPQFRTLGLMLAQNMSYKLMSILARNARPDAVISSTGADHLRSCKVEALDVETAIAALVGRFIAVGRLERMEGNTRHTRVHRVIDSLES